MFLIFANGLRVYLHILFKYKEYLFSSIIKVAFE